MSEETGAGGGAITRELLAVFGFGVDTSELKKGETSLGNFLETIKSVSVGLAGVFFAREIGEFAEANVRAMTEIERSATRLGTSTEEVQQFQFAARSLGMEAGELINMMGRLQVTQQAAAGGSKQAAAAFDALGVKTKDASGKSKEADQLFLDVADGIAKQTDASKRAAYATALFGRAGRELLPFLSEGSKGFEELREAYKQIGGGYSERAIAASKDYEKQSAKLDLALTSLKGTILEALLPVLTNISKITMRAVVAFREYTKQSNIMQAAMIVLGTIAAGFAIKMALAFAPVLLIAAAIAALILVVDDVITLLEGGKSAIGDTIDKLFGEGASLETIKQLKNIWQDIKDTIDDISDSIQLAQGALEAFTAGASGMTAYRAATGQSQGLDREMGEVTDRMKLRARARAYREHPELTGPAVVPPLLEGLPTPYAGTPAKPRRGRGATRATPAIAPPASNFETASAPRVSAPPPAPTTIVQGGETTIHVHPSPGMDEKQLGEHVAKVVGEVNKQERRAAAATFQRAPQGSD